jgi:Winged helix-turn-helix domain (DUF2582)
MEASIGDAAGVVWRYLDENGGTTLAKIARGTKLPEPIACMAVGWLAREGQVSLAQEKKSLVVALRR